MTLGPDSFARVVRVIVTSSGLSVAELSVGAGLASDVVGKILNGKIGYPALPTLCRLAAAARRNRARLAAEINRQLGLGPRREQGWRSPRIKLQEVLL